MYSRYEKLLKEKGVKNSQVCRATGIDKSTMSNWKNGKYTPKPDKMQKIADYFGVPLMYFYDNGTDNVESWFEDIDDYVDEMTSLKNVLQMDKDLRDADFTAEQLDRILEYAKWLVRK